MLRWLWVAASLAVLAGCRHRPARPSEAAPAPATGEPGAPATQPAASAPVAPTPAVARTEPLARRGELRVALWSVPGSKPPEVELLESHGFVASEPALQALMPDPDRTSFGYERVSWRLLESGLELRRLIAEDSVDIAELTPEMEAPAGGRVVTGPDAYLVACGCQPSALGAVDRTQLLTVLPPALVRAAYGLIAEQDQLPGVEAPLRWPAELWVPRGDDTLQLIARRLQALAAMSGGAMSLRAIETAELNRRRRAGTAPPCLLRYRRLHSDAALAREAALAALAGPAPAGHDLSRAIAPLLFLDARYWIAPGIAGVGRSGFGVLDLGAARPPRSPPAGSAP